MATQLNIKDPATIDLARSLARRSGKSVTVTIRDALERFDRDRRTKVEALLAELHAINPDPRDLLAPEWRDKSSIEICNSIYDEDGSFAG